MRRRLILLSFLAALVAALPAQAQDEEPPHILPFEVHVGGGFTFLMSEVGQYFGDGYHVNTGLTLFAKPSFGLQLEYGFTRLGSLKLTVPGTAPSGLKVQPVTATGRVHSLDLNLVARPRTASRVKPYVVGGVGLYRRPVKLTATAAGYVPDYCYAYYYACRAGSTVQGSDVLEAGSTTGFGINIGGGVFVLMSREAGGGFYVESRYHYTWGPELKDAQGAAVGKANARFLPVTIGLRF
jgi:hypothetical protein